MRLTACQRDGVVEQNLVCHVHTRSHRRSDRQQARVVVGAVAHVLEHVGCFNKGTHADPRRALGSHVGIGRRPLGVDIQRQRMAADARTGFGALDHLG